MTGATSPPKSTAITRSLGASLAIQSVGELMQLADILWKGGADQIAGLGRPEKVAHVILAGAEVGFTPTQALGCIMLLDGKTTIYGDGGLALVRASGLLEGEVNEVVEGEGDDRHATCKMRRKGESEKTFTFSMADARRAGLIDRAKGKGPWATYPDRMLKMRARGFALRDLFSDVLRGLAIYEEVQDASVVNTEVKVIGATADKPHAEPVVADEHGPGRDGRASDAASVVAPKQLEPAKQTDNSGPVTDAQANEFRRLRKLVLASKGAHDAEDQKAAWSEALSAYGVTSVAQLTRASAEPVIADLIVKHDPFTAGPSDPSESKAA